MKFPNMLWMFLLAYFPISNPEGLDLNFHQNDYQLKYERLELVRYNKNRLEGVSIVTFKYNRTTAVTNITFTPKIDSGTYIEGIVQVYKFMSNEYRFYPIHFAANVCEFLAVNSGGIRSALARCGNFVGCPFIKGIHYHGCNLYPDAAHFPPLIPNGEYKIEMQMLHASQEIMVAAAYVTVSRPIV